MGLLYSSNDVVLTIYSLIFCRRLHHVSRSSSLVSRLLSLLLLTRLFLTSAAVAAAAASATAAAVN